MSLQLLVGADALIAAWVGLRIPHAHDFGPSVALGLVDEHGLIQAGAVFHNYQPQYAAIEISFALDGKGRLTRSGISGLLRYPFAQLGCQRVTACTPRKLRGARRFLKKLGFKEEGQVRLGFGTDDAFIYGLLAKEWAVSPLNRDREGLSRGKEQLQAAARA